MLPVEGSSGQLSLSSVAWQREEASWMNRTACSLAGRRARLAGGVKVRVSAGFCARRELLLLGSRAATIGATTGRLTLHLLAESVKS